MRYTIYVECPNEDCPEGLVQVADATPGDPGRVSGPPEVCYPPEPGEIEGPDNCPHCGVDLPWEFWDGKYDEIMRKLIDAEEEDRASYLADRD